MTSIWESTTMISIGVSLDINLSFKLAANYKQQLGADDTNNG